MATTYKYAHTNLVAKDWKALAAFYQRVFECEPVPPQRNLAGEWLSEAIGVSDAVLEGMHLRLPGHGEHGPTLEIFTYDAMLDKPEPVANRLGLAHLAFQVDDVRECVRCVLEHGGSALGTVVEHEIPGVGLLTFVYATDPEGNIVEIMNWS